MSDLEASLEELCHFAHVGNFIKPQVKVSDRCFAVLQLRRQSLQEASRVSTPPDGHIRDSSKVNDFEITSSSPTQVKAIELDIPQL